MLETNNILDRLMRHGQDCKLINTLQNRVLTIPYRLPLRSYMKDVRPTWSFHWSIGMIKRLPFSYLNISTLPLLFKFKITLFNHASCLVSSLSSPFQTQHERILLYSSIFRSTSKDEFNLFLVYYSSHIKSIISRKQNADRQEPNNFKKSENIEGGRLFLTPLCWYYGIYWKQWNPVTSVILRNYQWEFLWHYSV